MGTILYISIVLFIVSLLLNCLGVHLLTAIKPVSNSKVILCNLAVTEILLCVTEIAFNLEPANLFVRALLGVVWLAYYSSILFLTIDRLIAIRLPLKYRVVITKKRLKLAIGTAWTLAMMFGTSFYFVSGWSFLFWKYASIVLDVTFIALCVLTYGYIFVKIFLRRRFDDNGQETNDGRRQRLIINRERKFVKIAGLIVFSFVLLALVPDIILYQYGSNWVGIFLPVGIITDPVIYIFLQDDLRSLLKRRVLRRSGDKAPTRQETTL